MEEELPTLWFVMYAVPPLELIASGSLPGYEFGVCSEKVVRDGEVKCIRSRGRGTNFWFASSMTQLKTPQL